MGRDIGSGEKEGREKRGKEEKVGGAVVRERETEAAKDIKYRQWERGRRDGEQERRRERGGGGGGQEREGEEEEGDTGRGKQEEFQY